MREVVSALLRLRVHCLQRGSFVAHRMGAIIIVEVFNYSLPPLQRNANTCFSDSLKFSWNFVHCVGDQLMVNQHRSL